MVEMIYICDTCNEPSETVTHEEIVETSYGNGQLVSEVITWEGSKCCGSECYEWNLKYWISEFPSEALEYGYITQKQYNKIIEDE